MTIIYIALSPRLFHVTPAPMSRLVIRDLQTVSLASAVPSPESFQPSAEVLSSSSVTPATVPLSHSQSIPTQSYPFKPMLQSRSSNNSPVKTPGTVPGRAVLGSALDFGYIPTIRGNIGQKRMILDYEWEYLRLRDALSLWNHRDLIVRNLRSC